MRRCTRDDDNDDNDGDDGGGGGGDDGANGRNSLGKPEIFFARSASLSRITCADAAARFLFPVRVALFRRFYPHFYYRYFVFSFLFFFYTLPSSNCFFFLAEGAVIF